MIKLVMETIIPADAELGMPSASEINLELYQTKFKIEVIVHDFLNLLSQIANELFQLNFERLSYEERIKVIETTKLKNIRLFSEFMTHCFRAYYSDYIVLEKLNAGSLPPFPSGNLLEFDDWEILEPVYERGYKVRDLTKQGV